MFLKRRRILNRHFPGRSVSEYRQHEKGFSEGFVDPHTEQTACLTNHVASYYHLSLPCALISSPLFLSPAASALTVSVLNVVCRPNTRLEPRTNVKSTGLASGSYRLPFYGILKLLTALLITWI